MDRVPQRTVQLHAPQPPRNPTSNEPQTQPPIQPPILLPQHIPQLKPKHNKKIKYHHLHQLKKNKAHRQRGSVHLFVIGGGGGPCHHSITKEQRKENTHHLHHCLHTDRPDPRIRTPGKVGARKHAIHHTCAPPLSFHLTATRGTYLITHHASSLLYNHNYTLPKIEGEKGGCVYQIRHLPSDVEIHPPVWRMGAI